MQRPVSRSRLVPWVTIGFVLGVTVSAGAQGRLRGEITDEWDNPLEGVTVLAEPTVSGAPQTTMTDDDGRFQFLGLVTGDWSFTATLDGYQGLLQGGAGPTACRQPTGGFRAAGVGDRQPLS